MATTSIHIGSLESIPGGASPGLLFLKELLPSWDALGKPPKPVREFFNNETSFVTNSNDPTPVGQVLQGLIKRVDRLAKLHREVTAAYDVGKEDGTRTVIFEAINSRVLKNDPSNTEVKGKEVTVLELKPVDGKLVAVEVRTTLENHALSVHQRKLGGAGAA
ncbi:putative SnoaL-like domain-containing protein [Seiridium cardinale]|uniref:SnoaL-like domain-containing protein n=1 Tax=Seiridium cardinale TaxID=138064 RepID=A0ABR2XFQ8_9PEZI